MAHCINMMHAASLFCVVLLPLPWWLDCLASGLASQYALRHIFLHQNLTGCRDMVARGSYPSACEIFTVDDKIALVEAMKGCLCSEWIDGLSCQNEQGMICIPVSVNGFHCQCKSQKKDPYVGGSYGWTPFWIQSSAPALYRQLCDTNTGECVSYEFWLGVSYLVVYLDMPESIFSASGTNLASHLRRARIDVDTHTPDCTWAPDSYNTTTWIQYDLQKPYSVMGFIMKTKCNGKGDKYTSSLSLTASNDELQWITVADNVTLEYQGDWAIHNSTFWFEDSVTRRYWRFYPHTWTAGAVYPHIKADFIGYLWETHEPFER